MKLSANFSAFDRANLIGQGPQWAVARTVKRYLQQFPDAAVSIYSDDTRKLVAWDLAGTEDAVATRFPIGFAPIRGRGRPKLGVVSKEVTLLPEDWDWLAKQPGGSSAALRKMVEIAQADETTKRQKHRRNTEIALFLVTALGASPNLGDALNALLNGDQANWTKQMVNWPKEIRDYITTWPH
jgi:uncharacterized protein